MTHRFNPLPSQEGRQSGTATVRKTVVFQSTPFARRETSFGSGVTDIVNVSIHSLRKKGDRHGK